VATADTDGRRAAIERFERFARGLERLGLQDFRLVVPSRADVEQREAWRAEAERLAVAAGIADVLHASRSAVREHVARVFAGGGFRPTWAGLNWGLSTGRAEDQAAVMEAVADAVTAEIVEPLAPAELVDGLRAPFERIAGAHPMPTTDGELPYLFGGAAVPPILILVLAVAVIGAGLAGWTFLVVPLLFLAWVVRRLPREP
jgi:hypothetical protein